MTDNTARFPANIFSQHTVALGSNEVLATVRYICSCYDDIPDEHIRAIANLEGFRWRCKGTASVYALWPDGVFALLLFPRWRNEPWPSQLIYAYKQSRDARCENQLICQCHRGAK